MPIAYLDTASGIAGDMMLAALVDAGASAKEIERKIQSLGLPKVQLHFSETFRCGFRSLQLEVRYPPEHVCRGLGQIESMIEQGALEAKEKELALRIFRKIGQVEARVHGVPIESVHFHEVGAVDSIADIVGVSIGITALGIERVFSGPPALGTGSISIAHGSVSVPAPATAELLLGVPLRASHISAELTTPTGAAILTTLSDQYGPMPSMKVEAIGYGAGHRDFPEQPNILRIFIGQLINEQCHNDYHNHHDSGHDHSHDDRGDKHHHHHGRGDHHHH